MSQNIYGLGDMVYVANRWTEIKEVQRDLDSDEVLSVRVTLSPEGSYGVWVRPEEVHHMSVTERLRRIEERLGLD